MPKVIGSKTRSKRPKREYEMKDCNKVKINEHADSLEAKQSIFNSEGFRFFLTREPLGFIFGCTLVFSCIGAYGQG